MKGTEKQINFANSLVNEASAKIAKFEAAGKGERFSLLKQLILSINEETPASNVIDIMKESTPYCLRSVEAGHITFERMIEFLNTGK